MKIGGRMKAGEVMKELKICRNTLYNYTKKGHIRVQVGKNGFYNYNEEDVKNFYKNKEETDEIKKG